MAIIRDVVLLNVFTFLVGYFLAMTIPSLSFEEAIPLIGLINIIIITLAFFIMGCAARINRFQHLRNVAILVWLGSIVNIYILPGANFLTWLASGIFIFIAMLVGGGLSLLVVPNSSANHKNSKSKNQSVTSNQTWLIGLAASVASAFFKDLILHAINKG
ncbi:hypothetical protein BLD44_008600 [Mastigocladus laminosus UU774]|nr:hypothetical protein BLD44_008600 [Mastigocladus laminosus UU774]